MIMSDSAAEEEGRADCSLSIANSDRSDDGGSVVAVVDVQEQRQRQKRSFELTSEMLEKCRKRAVESVPLPAANRLSIEELYSVTREGAEATKVPNCSLLRDHFAAEGRLDNAAAVKLLEDASRLLRQEPSLLRLSAPINGQ